MSHNLFPGHATAWVDVIKTPDEPHDALETFRNLVKNLAGTGQGVRVIGNVSPLSHYGDICRLARIPAIFAPTLADADQAAALRATSSASAEIAFARAFNRANLRVLVRVSELECDAQGNARRAVIEHLDGTVAGARWIGWRPGKRICLSGFRIELRDTKRAGLHLRVGIVIEDSPRDARGYRTAAPRFISTVKLDREGLLVVRPHDPVEPAYALSLGQTPQDDEEREILIAAVTHCYQASPANALLYASGGGLRLTGRAPEYAISKAA